SWGGDNMPRYASAEYDAIWDELASTALEDPARAQQLVQLQDLLVEGGIVIPLIHRGDVSAFGIDIHGVGDLNSWDSQYWNIEDWTREG
ncbi:MAG: peptide ABC transporter substrate-binding protein, partial [Acidimicrobiia bacterium]